MLNLDTSCKFAFRQLYGNMLTRCGCTASLIVALLLPGVFLPCTGVQLCGGIRHRFVCDDQDPAVFHICLGNHQYTMRCSGDLHFNARTQNCDWPKSVNCVEESKSKKSADTVSHLLTESTMPELSVNRQRDSTSSSSRFRPAVSSTPTKSELSITAPNIKTTEEPTLLESTSLETPIFRYRLKAVSSTEKPLESLLPDDEKVLEEVKKLSEELKQIDNYLQSLESDQVGFLIEPYKAKIPQRPQSYTSRYLHPMSKKQAPPSFSPYRNRLMTSKSPFHKMSSSSPFAMKSEKYRITKLKNNSTPSMRESSEGRTRSPYKPITTLYRDINVPTAYKWHDIPENVVRYSNGLSKKEFDINLINESDPFPKKETTSIYTSPSIILNTVPNSNQNLLPSSKSTLRQGIRSGAPRAMHKTYTFPQSIFNSVSSSSPSLNKITQQSEDDTEGIFQHTSTSSTFQKPSSYSQMETGMSQTTSQQNQEKEVAKNIYNPFASRAPSSSTKWWSTTRYNSSSVSPFFHRFSKSVPTTTPREYTNDISKLNPPVEENLSTLNTATASPKSSPWWSSTQSDYKYTKSPEFSSFLDRRKFQRSHNIPKPNYENTKIPQSEFVLVPTNQKSSSYKSQQDDKPLNAPAALERNVVRSPTAKKRSFSLQQVNAAASSDKITLHKPFDNTLNKMEAASQIDKMFDLLKYDEDSNKEIRTRESPIEKYDTKKGQCSSSWCQLPDCRCVGSDIPGDLDVKDVPQMVMLTFDDSINSQNMHYFRGLFNGTIRNPNGCPIKSTFFVSGDNSDYDMVRRVHKQGHEIASHTLSHRNPTTWWAHAGYDDWEQEVVGMRDRLHEKSGVPVKEITGMRAPFLQVGGDAQYAMLKENKFRYDSSMVTGNLYSNNQPPIWPFTLDTPPDSRTCSLTPCPTRSFPGLWEVPLIRWYGSNRIACAMPDACTVGFGIEGSRQFMEENFNRHYTTNRAPLGIFIHASWFGRKNGNFKGLYEFLASLADKEDVWVVTVNQALDWIQHPVRLSALDVMTSWTC